MKLGCIGSIGCARESNSNSKALPQLYARDIDLHHCTACSNRYLGIYCSSAPQNFPARRPSSSYLHHFRRNYFVNHLYHAIVANCQLFCVAMEEDNLSQAALVGRDESKGK